MKTFEILYTATVKTAYAVQAETSEEAEAKFDRGVYGREREIDLYDVEIIATKEIP